MNNNGDHKKARGRPLPRGQTGSNLTDRGVRAPAMTDLLILSDGRVLAHNLTPCMADVLHKINPEDETMRRRTRTARQRAASAKTDLLIDLPAT